MAPPLYGMPFLRRYPASILVVVTLRYLPGVSFAAPRPAGARRASHTATESPCQLRRPGAAVVVAATFATAAVAFPAAGAFANLKTRVWVPASVSMRRGWSSCQVT